MCLLAFARRQEPQHGCHPPSLQCGTRRRESRLCLQHRGNWTQEAGSVVCSNLYIPNGGSVRLDSVAELTSVVHSRQSQHQSASPPESVPVAYLLPACRRPATYLRSTHILPGSAENFLVAHDTEPNPDWLQQKQNILSFTAWKVQGQGQGYMQLDPGLKQYSQGWCSLCVSLGSSSSR